MSFSLPQDIGEFHHHYALIEGDKSEFLQQAAPAEK